MIHDGSQHAYKSSIDCLESPEKTYVLIVTAAFLPPIKMLHVFTARQQFTAKGEPAD